MSGAAPGDGRRRFVSVITGCYNEEENVEVLREQIGQVFDRLDRYDYEILFIDNHSEDRTVEKVKGMAERDPRVKLIVNARNFGHIRSPFHAFLQARGEAVIMMASDLQDPPALIEAFLARWEEGHPVVVAVKTQSRESRVMWTLRCAYYRLLYRIADVKVIENFTGFGLYDRKVVELIRGLGDAYPYFRGIIAELGFQPCQVPFLQPTRERGLTKNNFYTLYDMAMLGVTSHSKVPLRLATFGGFALGGVSLLISLYYLVMKLLYWHQFSLGQAPLVIGVFFFAAVQLFFIGLLGEYVLAIHTQVMKRPHVVEQERVNLEEPPR